MSELTQMREDAWHPSADTSMSTRDIGMALSPLTSPLSFILSNCHTKGSRNNQESELLKA